MIINVAILIILCSFVAILRSIYGHTTATKVAPFSPATFKRFPGNNNSFISGIIAFLTFALLINGLVPISLYVMVEFCRLVQVSSFCIGYLAGLVHLQRHTIIRQSIRQEMFSESMEFV